MDVTSISLTGGGVVILLMTIALVRYRDPFHPAVYLGLMGGYLWIAAPFMFSVSGVLEDYPASPADEAMAQGIVTLSLICLLAGTVTAKSAGAKGFSAKSLPRLRVASSNQILIIAGILFVVAMTVYLLQVAKAGGFAQAYGVRKGGGSSLGSGWINELPLLSLPAAVFYLLAKSNRRLSAVQFFVAIILVSPILLHGLLGARRGPTFLALSTVGISWYLVRHTKPSIPVAMGGVVLLGLLMLFLASQRGEIYIGSDFELDREGFVERVLPTTFSPGHTTIAAWSYIIASDHFNRHYGGQRYFVQLFVRPIPRQVWPTKYEDLGFGHLRTQAGTGGFLDEEWMEAVGTMPLGGSAIGFAADLFTEFGRPGLVVAFLIGVLYGQLWYRSASRRGVWTLLYLQLSAVSVYLISQGVISAWLYRFLLLAVPTYLLWKYLAPKFHLDEPGKKGILVRLPKGQAPPPGAIRVPPPMQRTKTESAG